MRLNICRRYTAVIFWKGSLNLNAKLLPKQTEGLRIHYPVCLSLISPTPLTHSFSVNNSEQPFAYFREEHSHNDDEGWPGMVKIAANAHFRNAESLNGCDILNRDPLLVIGFVRICG